MARAEIPGAPRRRGTELRGRAEVRGHVGPQPGRVWDPVVEIGGLGMRSVCRGRAGTTASCPRSFRSCVYEVNGRFTGVKVHKSMNSSHYMRGGIAGNRVATQKDTEVQEFIHCLRRGRAEGCGPLRGE